MADYIERDTVLKLCDYYGNEYSILKFAFDEIDDTVQLLPAADVFEVIRCKDCKWKQGAECVRFSDVRPFPDDFCSRAERRENETD